MLQHGFVSTFHREVLPHGRLHCHVYGSFWLRSCWRDNWRSSRPTHCSDHGHWAGLSASFSSLSVQAVFHRFVWEAVMRDAVESCAEVKTASTSCAPLLHHTSRLIEEGSWAAQAWFPCCKSMLPAPIASLSSWACWEMLSRRVLLHQLSRGGAEAFQPVVLWILVLEDESRAFSILKTCKEWQNLQVGLKQRAPTFMCWYINHIQIYVHVHKTIQGTYECRRRCMASGLRLEQTLFCCWGFKRGKLVPPNWGGQFIVPPYTRLLSREAVESWTGAESKALPLGLGWVLSPAAVQGSVCLMWLAVLHWGWGGCSFSLKALTCLLGLWWKQSLSYLCFSTSALVPWVTGFFQTQA